MRGGERACCRANAHRDPSPRRASTFTPLARPGSIARAPHPRRACGRGDAGAATAHVKCLGDNLRHRACAWLEGLLHHDGWRRRQPTPRARPPDESRVRRARHERGLSRQPARRTAGRHPTCRGERLRLVPGAACRAPAWLRARGTGPIEVSGPLPTASALVRGSRGRLRGRDPGGRGVRSGIRAAESHRPRAIARRRLPGARFGGNLAIQVS